MQGNSNGPVSEKLSSTLTDVTHISRCKFDKVYVISWPVFVHFFLQNWEFQFFVQYVRFRDFVGFSSVMNLSVAYLCMCLCDFRQFWSEGFWWQFRLGEWVNRVCWWTRLVFAGTALSTSVLWHHSKHVSYAGLSHLHWSTAVCHCIVLCHSSVWMYLEEVLWSGMFVGWWVGSFICSFSLWFLEI